MKWNIRSKTMLQLIPGLLLVLGGIGVAVSMKGNAIIDEQTESIMSHQLGELVQGMESKLVAHSHVAESLAKVVRQDPKSLSLERLRALDEGLLEINPDTFGIGVFFSPKAYDGTSRYFSTYAYRKDGKVASTEDYNAVDYDYPNQAWYKLADGQKTGVFYTPPYFDELTAKTMMTASIPFWTSKGFGGVVTGDIDITTIQKDIRETRVGATGFAMLLGADGTYIAGPDAEKTMKLKLQDDPDPQTAKLAQEMLGQAEGRTTWERADGVQQVVFSHVGETGWIAAVVLPVAEFEKPVQSLIKVIVLIGLAALFLSIMFILVFTRNIASHLRSVGYMADGLAGGDFTRKIPIKTTDEFGQMAGSLNQTNDMLRDMVAQVAQHASQVAAASEQLSAGADQTGKAAENIATTIQEVAAGAEGQMESTAQSARAMEELAEGIGRIAESAGELLETSMGTSGKAAEGRVVLQSAVHQMENVRQSSLKSSEVMEHLRTQTEQIDIIVKTIEDISRQTQLLALNASIEAARAGEFGRGFQVVASEIRKLADGTERSTHQVKMLIEEIQAYTKMAVNAVSEGKEGTDEGVKLMTGAQMRFEVILTDIRTMVERIQEISASTEQVSAGSQEVTAGVEELARIAVATAEHSQSVAAASEEQLPSTEETAASAEHLKQQMNELRELLGRFKI